jgi:hypothetical protein
MPVHFKIHVDHTQSGRLRFTVLLHSDLYMLAEVCKEWSFISTLPICLDGTVLTCRYGSVGKQNAICSVLCGRTTVEQLHHVSELNFPVTVTESHSVM